jgi:hypothetical protein
VASAEAATGVTAAAPATVLGEGWMRSESEKRGEDQRSEKARRLKTNEMIAIGSAEKYAAGKVAFDCVVFRTDWPVDHFTLLAH